MQRGVMTRGRYARLMEGAEAIEIKATIPTRQVQAALKRYQLTRNNDEQRFISFFDTPKLGLLATGIVMRARRVVGDERDAKQQAKTRWALDYYAARLRRRRPA
jgi:hypothetical protein